MYSNMYDNSHRLGKVIQTIVSYSDFIRSKDKMPIERGSISDNLGSCKSKLTLLSVTEADSGDYICVSQAGRRTLKFKTYFHVKIYSKLM